MTSHLSTVDQASALISSTEAAVEAIMQSDLPGTPAYMVANAQALETHFCETAEQYMHNETTLAFLSTVQGAAGLPRATVDDLKSLQQMHTEPPSSRALLQSSISASCELGEAVAHTRSALAEVTQALNAQQAGKRVDGQEVTPSAAVAAAADAATAAAQQAVFDASTQLQAAQEVISGTQAEEQALLRQLADLKSRSEALQSAAAERLASAASPSQQAIKVQQWYTSTAEKLGSLTGCSVASVKPLPDGTVLAVVHLAALPDASFEVLCAMPQGSAAGHMGDELPGHSIKSVAVKGSLALGGSQVAELQLQAMREGHLGGFQAACC